MKYIWQLHHWPNLRWQDRVLLPVISRARLEQGKLLSKVTSLGFDLGRQACADILTEEAVKTSAIEGEHLNRDSVRSSVARHLGLPPTGHSKTDRAVDGLIEVLLDATRNHKESLTLSRIKTWHAALFPNAHLGLSKMRAGQWRKRHYPMRVVSGPIGKETIHFEAPPGERMQQEMKHFIAWWKKSADEADGLIRSGLAHLIFVTIHPFDDGNGRIARVLSDMALAQDEKLSTRFYSLSSQIMEEREQYYTALERSQKSGLDVTFWLKWYLECYLRAVHKTDSLLENVLFKSQFWKKMSRIEINARQKKVINRLLDAGKDGFEGGLTTRKYVSMAKVSRTTAFREISDLLDKKILVQNSPRGRSVSYDLGWN